MLVNDRSSRSLQPNLQRASSRRSADARTGRNSFRARIGDEMNGFEAAAEHRPKDPAWAHDAAVARWLHETAIRLYLESDYAKKHR
jgi:hypothetical protein